MPPVTFGDVRSWRPGPLGTAGDGLKRDADELERSRDALATQSVPSSWTGLARLAAEVRRRALVARVESHVEGKRTVQRALYEAETDVTEIERMVADIESAATAQQFALGDDGSVTDVSDPPTFESVLDALEWTTRRSSQARALADEITVVLGKAAAVDALLAGSIPRGHVDHVDDYGVASPEVAEAWATMTDAERRAFIEQYVEEYADRIGIDTPEIVYEPESWGPWGQARDNGGTIALNEGILDDPFIINTVAHEMRHAHQYEAIDDQDDFRFPWQEDPFDMHEDQGISEDDADTWEENFDDYQSTDNGDTYEEYFDQPVEVDARAEGKDALEDMTADEVERLTEEGRR